MAKIKNLQTEQNTLKNGVLHCVVVFALILRWSTSLHSYSGEGTPPMYGDYEAQRHWMEITLNLPVEQWYQQTKENDLEYWGLDYPPLTAYHSYVNGLVANFTNPKYVDLFESRGYESYYHKYFMRSTVIVSDFLCYFTFAIYFLHSLYKKFEKFQAVKRKGSSGEVDHDGMKGPVLYASFIVQATIFLLYPGIILIDHGHFQYNSISLGLTIGAVAFLINKHFVSSTIMFCLALNYKQMSLYHSLPFFIYILSHSLFRKRKTFLVGLKRLIIVSLTVMIVFFILWLPFLRSLDLTVQVLNRLFPLARGVFEDKVANVWCTVNVFFKLNLYVPNMDMAKICILMTLQGCLPSLIYLFRFPTINNLILSLINVSLAFFLFSFQVHEKSILLVAIPVLLQFPFDPFPCFWFLLISTFSLLPLLLKDNLILPFISLTLIFSFLVFGSFDFPVIYRRVLGDDKEVYDFYPYLILFFKLSMFGHIALFICSVSVAPPLRYPDLWSVLNSIYCCAQFILFSLYFNFSQITSAMRN